MTQEQIAKTFHAFILEPTQPDDKPRHELWCWLLFANGGFEVKQPVEPTEITTTTGLQHQFGLDLKDTVNLLQIRAFLDGMQAAGFDWNQIFWPHWEQYVVKYIGEQPKPTMN